MNRRRNPTAVRPELGAGGGAAAAAPPAAAGARKPLRHRGTDPRWAGWAFLAPVVTYLVAFYAYPLYRNLDLSLRTYTVRSFVQGGAPFSGLDNYRAVVQNATFGPALLHTVLFTGISLILQFSIGMALAVFFVNH